MTNTNKENPAKVDFNPSLITDEMRNTVIELAQLKVTKEFIEDIENNCSQKVLSENVFYGHQIQRYESGNIIRDEDTNEPLYATYRVLSPKEEDSIYRYGEEHFGDFLQLQTKELEEKGIYKKSYELGTSLVIASKISDLQRDLINQLEPITGVKNNQLYMLDNRRKALELIEKMIITTMSDEHINEMKKTFLQIAPILEFDNKIRVDVNLRRNDALADFSKSVDELVYAPVKDAFKTNSKDFVGNEVGFYDKNGIVRVGFVVKIEEDENARDEKDYFLDIETTEKLHSDIPSGDIAILYKKEPLEKFLENFDKAKTLKQSPESKEVNLCEALGLEWLEDEEAKQKTTVKRQR